MLGSANYLEIYIPGNHKSISIQQLASIKLWNLFKIGFFEGEDKMNQISTMLELHIIIIVWKETIFIHVKP